MIVGIVYLVIGFLHAAYLFVGGYSPWYMFLFDTVLGPPVLIYILIGVLKGKRLPLA